MQYIYSGNIFAFWGTVLIGVVTLLRAHAVRKAAVLIVVSEAIYFAVFFLAFLLAPIFAVPLVFILCGAIGACGMTLAIRKLLKGAALGQVADVAVPSLLACLTFLAVALAPLFLGQQAAQTGLLLVFGILSWLLGVLCGVLLIRPRETTKDFA